MEEEKREEAKTEGETENAPAVTEKEEGGTESQATESKETETEDKGTEGGGETGKPKTKQTREEDARYAELRRQNEKLQREIGEYRTRENGRVSDKALRDLNLTREDLNDEENIRIVRNYEKAVAEGVENPVGYAYRAEYSKARDERRKATEQDNAMRKETEEFTKLYGRDTFKKALAKDSDFLKVMGDTIQPGNLCQMYGVYLRVNQAVKGTAPERKVTEAEKAKAAAPTGKPKDIGEPDLRSMSDEEFRRWYAQRNSKYSG